MNLRLSPQAPTSVLEMEAAEQRRRLHRTVNQLREQVRYKVHEKLDVRRHASEHVWPAAGAALLFSLLFGYGTAGIVKHIFS